MSFHEIKQTAIVVTSKPTPELPVGFYKVVYPNGNYGGVFRVCANYKGEKFVMEWNY